MARLRVEVVYALPEAQDRVQLELEEGATAGEALEASGTLVRHPEIAPAHLTLGVYGRVVRPDERLKDGDRVEIYRPLIADPKQARRSRAAKKR